MKANLLFDKWVLVKGYNLNSLLLKLHCLWSVITDLCKYSVPFCIFNSTSNIVDIVRMIVGLWPCTKFVLYAIFYFWKYNGRLKESCNFKLFYILNLYIKRKRFAISPSPPFPPTHICLCMCVCICLILFIQKE